MKDGEQPFVTADPPKGGEGMESEEYREKVVGELRRIRISLYVLAKIALPTSGLGRILDGILEEQFREEPAPSKEDV